MEPITKVSHIPASRWALSCSLCREHTGTCIQVQRSNAVVLTIVMRCACTSRRGENHCWLRSTCTPIAFLTLYVANDLFISTINSPEVCLKIKNLSLYPSPTMKTSNWSTTNFLVQIKQSCIQQSPLLPAKLQRRLFWPLACSSLQACTTLQLSECCWVHNLNRHRRNFQLLACRPADVESGLKGGIDPWRPASVCSFIHPALIVAINSLCLVNLCRVSSLYCPSISNDNNSNWKCKISHWNICV